MKVTLVIILLIIGAGSFAKTYSYEGRSSIDGRRCEVGFDIEKSNKLSNLLLDGASFVNNKFSNEDKIDSGLITDYIDENFLIRKSLLSGSFIAKKTIRELEYNNRFILKLYGRSIDKLSSVEFESKQKVMSLVLGKVNFECLDLKTLK